MKPKEYQISIFTINGIIEKSLAIFHTVPYWAGRPDQTTASFAVKTHPKLSTFNGKLHSDRYRGNYFA